jgi:bifunctional UDP-N-acetylglucosamine pyrophosphorylase/glucosamine-1-phosphate N-acetyltransferase
MQHPDATAVILAAGKGTRMGSDLAKVLHPLAGRPLVAHVLDACRGAGVGRTVVVVGWQREQVEAAVRPWGPAIAVQDRQLGTGHAVRCAEAAVAGGTVLVLCGDTPLVRPALLDGLLARHAAAGAACTVLAARLADPGRYGRLVVEGGRLRRIVEWKDATADERAIPLINSGIYAFDRAHLFRCLASVTDRNAQGEYYLTDVVGLLAAEGRAVEAVETADPACVLGVNTPEDLAAAACALAAGAGA